jgi:hypothetical protein
VQWLMEHVSGEKRMMYVGDAKGFRNGVVLGEHAGLYVMGCWGGCLRWKDCGRVGSIDKYCHLLLLL